MGASFTKQESNQKVKPPFPLLPSFDVAALILCFVAHDDLVLLLMRKCNKNSRRYALKHKPILKKYLVQWKPETMVLEFGNEYLDWNQVYPSPENFR